MWTWVYRDGKYVQIQSDAVAPKPEKWLIVRRMNGEKQVYLRRKVDPWTKFEGWHGRNAPVMIFPNKDEALSFCAGLLIIGQVEEGKFYVTRWGLAHE
jgi:hypothetical protein